MACLLRQPTPDSKGILSITTPEYRNEVLKSAQLREVLEGLKSRYFIGLHHNWHDFAYKHDQLFDFNLAGEEDLKTLNGTFHPALGMDAVNFVPHPFAPFPLEHKHWDLLYVARGVYFKRPLRFLEVIRELFDQGFQCKVLFICPIPPSPKRWSLRRDRTIITEATLRSRYERLFSVEERRNFDLLTFQYGYPFPFTLESLAQFYRLSRVFLHTADDERRCRVVAYAAAGNLPVVGMPCVGSIFPTGYRKAPHFYEVTRDDQFADQALRAVEAARKGITGGMKELFLEEHSTKSLVNRFSEILRTPPDTGPFFLNNLSLRLGMHHTGTSSPNTYGTPLNTFVDKLGTAPIASGNPNPELLLEI